MASNNSLDVLQPPCCLVADCGYLENDKLIKGKVSLNMLWPYYIIDRIDHRRLLFIIIRIRLVIH